MERGNELRGFFDLALLQQLRQSIGSASSTDAKGGAVS